MSCAAGRPRLKGQAAQRAVSILYAFILEEEREVVKALPAYYNEPDIKCRTGMREGGDGMTFDQIIIWIIAAGVLIGAADKIFGNRLGLGEKFDAGFQAMGPLALGMVGIVCLAPVIADLAGPVIIPVFEALGADPAMFGAVLANDMGGYSLAVELAKNQEAGLLAGTIVSSMLGCTLVFSIPVGLSLIEKEDRPYFSRGFLIGLITIPAGSVIGGLAAGFELSMVLRNMIPVILLAAALALGLKAFPAELRNLLDELSRMDPKNYTQESWNNLSNLMGEAGELLESGTATTAQIQEMTQKLEKAKENLQPNVPSSDNTEQAKKELETFLKELDQLTSSDYTTDSWNQLYTLIEDAREMLKKGASKSEYDAMTAKLREASGKLVKAEEKDEETDKEETKPNTSEKPVKPQSGVQNVLTGDNAPIVALMFAGIASIVILGVICSKKMRKK